MSQDFRWAVLLCKCQGTSNNGDAQQFFVELFTPGLGGAIEYWNDMSYGQLDITRSSVFSWVELPITTTGILTTRRSDAIEAGITAHRKAGHDLDGFGTVLVYIDVPFVGQNVTEGGQAGAGAAGGKVLIDQGSRRPTFILHEMGHGHGLQHSRGAAGDDYGDPYCIMSAETFGGTNPAFQDERFGPSGPSLCSPYMDAKGWLPASFMRRIECDGYRPKPTRLSLNPIRRSPTLEIQVAVIEFTSPYPATYYIDFHPATG